MAKTHAAIPDTLYHYTSIEAFKSIMESKKMRATRYDQMNDMGELRLGTSNLLEAIKGRPVDDSLVGFKDFLISEVEDFGKGALDVYVLSLSAAADSLAQWRAYSPKGGVAIGFDCEKVRKGFLIDFTRRVGGLTLANPVRPDFSNRLMPCRYTDTDGRLSQDTLVTIADSFLTNSYAEGCASPSEPLREIMRSSLSVKVYRTICSIKHGAYSSEQEWRCVNHNPDPTDYPTQLSKNNRYYIEMAFEPNDYIKEVWVSPHGTRDAYEAAVMYYRERYNLRFAIRRSKIPFRGQ